MAGLVGEQFLPANDGLNTDTEPAYIGAKQAAELKNLLTDIDGSLRIRGGLHCGQNAFDIAAAAIIGGAWVFNDKVLVSRIALSATADTDPWSALYQKPPTEARLAVGETNMKYVELDTAGTVTNVAAGAGDRVVAGRGARIGTQVYGFALNGLAAASQTFNGGRQWNRPFLRWDGTTAAPTEYTNANHPMSGQDIIPHLNRLFVLGGIAPGGTVPEPNVLYFSDQIASTGAALADAVTAWQDDATGLVNRITVGEDDQNDFGVGLAKLGQNLVIFKRHSIWVLYGYSASTFTVRRVVSNIGCLDRRSIVERDDAVYFMGQGGYYKFDGTNVELIGGVARELARAASFMHVPTLTVGSWATGVRAVAMELPSDHIMLSVCMQHTNSGGLLTPPAFTAPTPTWLLLHLPTGRWTRLSADTTSIAVPTEMVRTSNHYAMIDNRYVHLADFVTNPEGLSPTWTDHGLDQRGAATTARIPASINTRLANLSSPPDKAQLHRFWMDYTWVRPSVADDAENAWQVTLRGGNGSTLLAATNVPSMSDSSSYLYKRRVVLDVFSEADDVQVRIAAPSGTTQVTDARIFAMGVEYQKTRQRRSS